MSLTIQNVLYSCALIYPERWAQIHTGLSQLITGFCSTVRLEPKRENINDVITCLNVTFSWLSWLNDLIVTSLLNHNSLNYVLEIYYFSLFPSWRRAVSLLNHWVSPSSLMSPQPAYWAPKLHRAKSNLHIFTGIMFKGVFHLLTTLQIVCVCVRVGRWGSGVGLLGYRRHFRLKTDSDPCGCRLLVYCNKQ